MIHNNMKVTFPLTLNILIIYLAMYYVVSCNRIFSNNIIPVMLQCHFETINSLKEIQNHLKANILSADKDTEQQEFSFIPDRNANWFDHTGKPFDSFLER